MKELYVQTDLLAEHPTPKVVARLIDPKNVWGITSAKIFSCFFCISMFVCGLVKDANNVLSSCYGIQYCACTSCIRHSTRILWRHANCRHFAQKERLHTENIRTDSVVVSCVVNSLTTMCSVLSCFGSLVCFFFFFWAVRTESKKSSVGAPRNEFHCLPWWWSTLTISRFHTNRASSLKYVWTFVACMPDATAKMGFSRV